MNQVSVTASVLEIKPLRYTPAGVPVPELTLHHESEVVEAGAARRIQFSIPAVALGDIALLVSQTPLGVALAVQGFLAPVKKGASKLVLHIQQASRVHAGGVLATV